MIRNVGGLDRVVRGVLGSWLLVVAVAALLDGERTKAVTAALAGGGLLVNYLTCFCGGNALFGLDTTTTESAADRGSVD
ncbi:DUF2892 domain-containing protein [Halorarum halophilum]|uniref:DUF2892 domain-containing protein n=1 Tax=Halorarum halophilum TaxID=2743090 RepID=A0A7D5KCS0_9EURY|nr:DUF2892 domain-containing protein [Halobaculum halophilum]QLG26917.1 DUF2892 domain-containing protein [Halobaculum halophilum]